MLDVLKESLWKQFGASIDMLKNAITLWPEESWNANQRFFYTAYHCLLFLDYYLSIPPTNFSSPMLFIIAEPKDIPAGAIDDLLPVRMYSKEELLNYLHLSRDKCRQLIAGLTEETITEQWIEAPDDLAAGATMNYSVLEILLYNMRHVQHHTAQLNLLLRQQIDEAPGWVARAEETL